jgi:hypothetical protein
MWEGKAGADYVLVGNIKLKVTKTFSGPNIWQPTKVAIKFRHALWLFQQVVQRVGSEFQPIFTD